MFISMIPQALLGKCQARFSPHPLVVVAVTFEITNTIVITNIPFVVLWTAAPTRLFLFQSGCGGQRRRGNPVRNGHLLLRRWRLWLLVQLRGWSIRWWGWSMTTRFHLGLLHQGLLHVMAMRWGRHIHDTTTNTSTTRRRNSSSSTAEAAAAVVGRTTATRIISPGYWYSRHGVCERAYE